MTVGHIILLSVLPLGGLLMLVFSYIQSKWMPPSRAWPAPSATENSGSPLNGRSQ